MATRPGNPGNPGNVLEFHLGLGNVLEVTKTGPCPGNQSFSHLCPGNLSNPVILIVKPVNSSS